MLVIIYLMNVKIGGIPIFLCGIFENAFQLIANNSFIIELYGKFKVYDYSLL